MHIEFGKKTRRILISLSAIFIIIFTFLMIHEIISDKVGKETNVSYKYTTKGDANYTVILKPNNLYDSNNLNQDQVYITDFIDRIEASFNYNFSGEKIAKLDGNYEITASLEGYTTSDKSEKIIWKKKYILVPQKEFKIEDKSMKLNEKVSINLPKYNDFVNQTSELSKIGSQIRLIVSMAVNLEGTTPNGIVKKSTLPTLIIPISARYFEVTKRGLDLNEGQLHEIKNIMVPINKSLMILYGIVFLFLVLGLLFLCFLTKSKKENLHIITLHKIFKKYGNLLVALNTPIEKKAHRYYDVHSMEDLSKFSDEVERPIMYQHNSNPEGISIFYVECNDILYIFDLENYLNEKNNSMQHIAQIPLSFYAH